MCASRCFNRVLWRELLSSLLSLFITFLAFSQNGNGSEGTLRSLKGMVNSDHNDLSPVLTLEEDLLFFTSDRPNEGEGDKDFDVYVSERGNNGEWKEARPLPFNTDKNERSVGVAPDGDRLFVHRDGDLFKVDRKEDSWGSLQRIGSSINSKHNEVHGSLSSDGNAFYFVSDRSGDQDIYRVKRMPTGEWSKAQELPSPINTTKMENAPFIHPDDRTLFFSSTARTDGNKPDIFYSKKGEEEGWSDPINMGYPISTKGANVHVMTSADGKRAYFASKSIEEGKDDRDLYRYDLQGSFTEGLAVLKGFIDVPTGSDLLDSVSVRIDRPKGMQEDKRQWVQRPRKRDGIFIAVLPPCHEYSLSFYLGDQKMVTRELFVPCKTSYKKLRQEVFLKPVEFDPSSLDRRPSLIGRIQHSSNKAPVAKGTVRILGKDGSITDSVSIDPKGGFSFYHPDPDRKAISFRFQKEGDCENTELEMRSGVKTFTPSAREGCVYRFPAP